PGALILLVLSALYSRGAWSPAMTRVMSAMSAAVVGLVFVTSARIVAASLKSARGVLIAAAMFVLVALFHLNTALALALVVPVSLCFHRPGSGSSTSSASAGRFSGSP